MNIRDQRQKEFSDIYLDNKKYGILLLCPRMGKCRVGVRIMENWGVDSPKVLIVYPNTPVKDSWVNEFIKCNYHNPNIIFTTTKSLHKYELEIFDLIILDEIHTLSENQIQIVARMQRLNSSILGLTGTLNRSNKYNLNLQLGMKVIAEYSYDQAIQEGVVNDYEIRIVECKLDNREKRKFNNKGTPRTELQHFLSQSRVIDKLEEKGKDPGFMRINRMRLFHDSIGKLNKTKEILQKHKDDRILVFCGLIKIAESLGIDTYHSESKDITVVNKFNSGEINQMATVNSLNAGVTLNNLRMSLLSNFDSNEENLIQRIMRCMNYNYEGDKSLIYIVCTNQIVEKNWLKKSLHSLDQNKIFWE